MRLDVPGELTLDLLEVEANGFEDVGKGDWRFFHSVVPDFVDQTILALGVSTRGRAEEALYCYRRALVQVHCHQHAARAGLQPAGVLAALNVEWFRTFRADQGAVVQQRFDLTAAANRVAGVRELRVRERPREQVQLATVRSFGVARIDQRERRPPAHPGPGPPARSGAAGGYGGSALTLLVMGLSGMSLFGRGKRD